MALVSVLAAAPRPALAAGDDVSARVREAALATYVHGMTAEIAERQFGADAVPVLLELLFDPDFPRRDNVVAALAFLADDDAALTLRAYLEQPTGLPDDPAEDRALLLAPQALGQIAGRANARALRILLRSTRHGLGGGVLARAASSAQEPDVYRDDLLEAAVRGLAYAGGEKSRLRLQGIAKGRIRPAGGRDLKAHAAHALVLLEALGGDAPDVLRGGAGSSGGMLLDGAPAGPANATATLAAPRSYVTDTAHTAVKVSRLSYANHPAVTSPMTDARLDSILYETSQSIGRSDFAADVACCAGAVRTRRAATFGPVGDGLDLIDNNTELNAVLNHSVARVKVVRAINYCGSPGTNIIGCAWVGGWGMALVRYGSDADTEGELWMHEYGHNVGLSHNADARYVMYGALYNGSATNNVAVSASECNAFHTPSPGTAPQTLDAGACTDADLDEVQDQIDNCPTLANWNQLDADGDRNGDVCDQPCSTHAECDDANVCNGVETCGGASGCVSGTPLACNDGNACNGVETCDAALGCRVGTAPTCGPVDGCCQAGCDAWSDEDCAVCGDGECTPGEDCDTCTSDCPSAGPVCGNGVCEAGGGEDCVSCAADCRGQTGGPPKNRFCCGDGDGPKPLTCASSTCRESGWFCDATPIPVFCCGDSTCAGLDEAFDCEVDCGAPPVCGDGTCSALESRCDCPSDCGAAPASESVCSGGGDEDCDGLTDCADGDCIGTPSCPVCEPVGSPCASAEECCTGRCSKPRGGAKVCQ